MDYLRGNAPASAVGLYVICRHLSRTGAPVSEGGLQKSLQVLRSSESPQSEASAVLETSLNVGRGLGLVVYDEANSTWTIDGEITNGLRDDQDHWPWFRGELAHRMMRHGLTDIDNGVPDLVLGLTWFLQQSPLNPLPTVWGAGTEAKIRGLGFKAVERSEQWLSFQRWALSLGFARRSDQPNAKVLIPDSSTAIGDQLRYLPSAGSAREWITAMHGRIPVAGAKILTDKLPKGSNVWHSLPQSVMFGLLKLEATGVLELRPSDDARDVLTIGLGGSTRQVGRISVRSPQ
ncbi:hypothetical protein [Mycolicibacterium fortuitum]|uniref:hypothetical protein n=1 Tax=Mycolicibacterium fortuitum TaxID=1766 RepID=UPI001CDD104A|nr:hypothetical protein [Mycolicibacterium fortuitum]UBV16879.1 hypothetical protein H8Z57_08765 [Mycolicibacterium fortuitum]